MTGRIYEQEPKLIEEIRAAGQEIAFHSYAHQSDWNRSYYASEVARCRELAGVDAVQGYRSPNSQWDKNTLIPSWLLYLVLTNKM